MELEAIAQPTLEQIERYQGIDLVVGVLGASANGRASEAAGLVHDALQSLSQAPRALLVIDDAGAPASAAEELPIPVLTCRLSAPGDPQLSPEAAVAAYQTLFGVCTRIGARACGLIATDLPFISAHWIDSLIEPLLQDQADLVTPLYARHKWEGLLNRSVLAPLARSLYGKRIQNPMGPDFGFSARLMKSMLDDHASVRRTNPAHPLAAMVSTAVAGNYQLWEAHLGARHRPPADWMNLSELIARILGPVFLDMEANAPLWQRVRGSQPVNIHGDPGPPEEEAGEVDVHHLFESFQLGARNLPELWCLVLPPTALVEIRRLARFPAESFRMPDDLWASIVYDFALAHRLRTINRDHLLRSFTPLYLGWVASYAIEMEGASAAAAEARTARLGRAFEAAKPYLVQRWRWPDRFNP